MSKPAFDLGEELRKQLGDVPNSGTEAGGTVWVDLLLLMDNPANFYPRPDAEAMAALMDSIEANGILEPPTVVPHGKAYRLISGHSRVQAVRRLHAEHPLDKRWEKVLCRVLPPMTADQELTAVIEANRQRVKTNALLALEAERLTAAYVKRKEAGEDLPGRVRDRVAETMQINKTKLANLAVIKRGLRVPGIIARWERDEIPEAAALEIARMDMDTQYRLLDWMIDKGRSYTINEVRRFKTIWTCCAHKCPETAGLCPNAERMYNAHYRGGNFYCAGCCKSCLKTDSCTAVCQYVEEQEDPEPEPETSSGKTDPRAHWEHITAAFSSRLKEARERTGKSRKEFAEHLGEFPGTYSGWENGNLPGSSRFPGLALELGVTTDYLFGLSDDPHPVPQPEGQLVLNGWMPGGTNPREACLCAVWLDLGGGELVPRIMYWDTMNWRFREGVETVRIAPTLWMALPERKGGNKHDRGKGREERAADLHRAQD